MIAKYCGKTLEHMDIEGHENTTHNFNALSQFKALRYISINSISMYHEKVPEIERDLFL